MSYIDPNARKAVNDAIVNTGAKGVGQIVDTANSSVEKRRQNKEEREKREAEERAAKEKADAAVRVQPRTPNPLTFQEAEAPRTCYVLTVINNRRAAPPARHGLPESLRVALQGRFAGLACGL